MKERFILLLITAVFFGSCKKDPAVFDPPGFEYFALKEGNEVEYYVDSIVYDEFKGTIDTFRFQIKEVIADPFIDGEGNEAFRIERFKRISDSLSWKPSGVWSANINPTSAQRAENNLRYMKLIFPVRKNRTWDGNSFNILPEQNYRYTQTHSGYSVGSFQFDSTVTVLQFENENLIEFDYAEERYAIHIGMVFKEFTSLKKNIQTGQIKSGLRFTMKIKDFKTAQ